MQFTCCPLKSIFGKLFYASMLFRIAIIFYKNCTTRNMHKHGKKDVVFTRLILDFLLDPNGSYKSSLKVVGSKLIKKSRIFASHTRSINESIGACKKKSTKHTQTKKSQGRNRASAVVLQTIFVCIFVTHLNHRNVIGRREIIVHLLSFLYQSGRRLSFSQRSLTGQPRALLSRIGIQGFGGWHRLCQLIGRSLIKFGSQVTIQFGTNSVLVELQSVRV